MVEGTPLDAAVASGKRGDLPGARVALGLPEGDPPDEELRALLRAVDEALRAFASGRGSDAQPGFERLARALEDSSDRQLAQNVATLEQFVAGAAALDDGDWRRALAELEPARDALAESGFGDSAEAAAAAGLARRLELLLHHARVMESFAKGDLEQAERELGEMRSLGDEWLAEVPEGDPGRASAVAWVVNRRLEIADELARTDLEALDVDRARARLEQSAADAASLRAVGAQLEAPGSQIVLANLANHDALVALGYVAEAVFHRHGSRRDRVDVARDRLRALHDAGAAVGIRGAGWTQTGERLGRMLESWLAATQETKDASSSSWKDRLPGLLFVAIFVGIILLFVLVGDVRGKTLAAIVVVVAVVALIGTFGPGALRFKPLLDTAVGGITAVFGKGGGAEGDKSKKKEGATGSDKNLADRSH